MTRRAAIGAMVAGGAGFALFGPRGKKDESAARGRIVLDYWEKWTRHEGDAMVRVVNAFNESQSRIFVRFIVVSDIGQKSLVAIAGNNPPDLIGLYAFNVPPYAEARAILPLDELAPKFGVKLQNYAQGVRQVMTHKGNWWATVNTAGSVALYYNKTLFREAGLDPEKPPRTIEELNACHRTLTRRDAGGTFSRIGFLHREPGWWSWIWSRSFGGGIYDAAGNRALVDGEPNLRAMRWLAEHARELGADTDQFQRFVEGFGNYFTPENPFLTGKVAMIVQGPWIANLVQAFKPDLDYGVAPFPVAGDHVGVGSPVGLIDTDVLVIPRGAKHPEAAMEFIAFTQRQDMTELLATAHCKPSPLAQASESFLAKHPNRGIRVHYDIFQSPRAFIPPPTPVWQKFKDEFDGMVLRIASLKEPPEQACTRLQRSVQALIDADAGQRQRRYGQSASSGGARRMWERHA